MFLIYSSDTLIFIKVLKYNTLYKVADDTLEILQMNWCASRKCAAGLLTPLFRITNCTYAIKAFCLLRNDTHDATVDEISRKCTNKDKKNLSSHSLILIRKIANQFIRCILGPQKKREETMLQYYIFYSMCEIRNVTTSVIIEKV